MGKLDTAVKALRDAADAVDAVPERFRRQSIFGLFVSTRSLRDEADHLAGIAEAIEKEDL